LRVSGPCFGRKKTEPILSERLSSMRSSGGSGSDHPGLVGDMRINPGRGFSS
jgi:hypothetical protein